MTDLFVDATSAPVRYGQAMAALYMSVKDVAARWDCHVGVVYRQVALGRLEALHIGGTKRKASHIGGTIRISIAAVKRFEDSNTTGR